MSFFVPAPLTMVVFFLVDHHLLGAAEHVHRDALELHAEFVRDQLPPVRIAMSSSIALRRSRRSRAP